MTISSLFLSSCGKEDELKKDEQNVIDEFDVESIIAADDPNWEAIRSVRFNTYYNNTSPQKVFFAGSDKGRIASQIHLLTIESQSTNIMTFSMNLNGDNVLRYEAPLPQFEYTFGGVENHWMVNNGNEHLILMEKDRLFEVTPGIVTDKAEFGINTKPFFNFYNTTTNFVPEGIKFLPSGEYTAYKTMISHYDLSRASLWIQTGSINDTTTTQYANRDIFWNEYLQPKMTRAVYVENRGWIYITFTYFGSCQGCEQSKIWNLTAYELSTDSLVLSYEDPKFIRPKMLEAKVIAHESDIQWGTRPSGVSYFVDLAIALDGDNISIGAFGSDEFSIWDFDLKTNKFKPLEQGITETPWPEAPLHGLWLGKSRVMAPDHSIYWFSWNGAGDIYSYKNGEFLKSFESDFQSEMRVGAQDLHLIGNDLYAWFVGFTPQDSPDGIGPQKLNSTFTLAKLKN